MNTKNKKNGYDLYPWIDPEFMIEARNEGQTNQFQEHDQQNQGYQINQNIERYDNNTSNSRERSSFPNQNHQYRENEPFRAQRNDQRQQDFNTAEQIHNNFDHYSSKYGERSYQDERGLSNSDQRSSQQSSVNPNQGQSRRYSHSQRENHGQHYGVGPKNFKRKDSRLEEKICERLMQDHELDASNITVSVKNGIASLNGTVDYRFAKYAAEECADQVMGLSDIENNLRVQRKFERHDKDLSSKNSSKSGAQKTLE